jgi:hypothetical protein
MNQASHAEEVHPDITSLLFQGLCELQKVYDNKENRGENSTMIIEEAWFQKHANLIPQVWELSKEPHNEPYDERISNIQKDIKEIKDTINNATATRPKTWAQVVAEGGITTAHAELAKRERMEKAKKAQTKTEVTLGHWSQPS